MKDTLYAVRPAPTIAPDRIGSIGYQRIWEPLCDEFDYTVDEIEGKLPSELRGCLYRNGMGKWESGGTPVNHMFDGDGMVSMFTLNGQSVHYRNRYVRTQHYLVGQQPGGPPLRMVGTQRRGGMLANLLRKPVNQGNTNVVLHAGHLLALWEIGKPWDLDPRTLDTLGEYHFDKRLGWLGAFSAHPKVDPVSGDLYNFGIDLLPRPLIRCFRLDRHGKLHHVRRVPLRRPVFIHDFALTENHMVFVIDPIVASLPGLLGFGTWESALHYRPEQGTSFVLVPRDGSKPRIVEDEALMHFHVCNAYEDRCDIVVDLIRYPHTWDEVNAAFRDFRSTDGRGLRATLWRFRVMPSGQVAGEELCTIDAEWPQYDWRRTGRHHRYSYLAARSRSSGPLTAILKVDHQTERSVTHDFGESQVVSEPTFVPRQPRAEEDEGWLLTVVYDPPTHRSRLVVLDPRALEDKALAIAWLRHHIPLSTHGRLCPRLRSTSYHADRSRNASHAGHSGP